MAARIHKGPQLEPAGLALDMPRQQRPEGGFSLALLRQPFAPRESWLLIGPWPECRGHEAKLLAEVENCGALKTGGDFGQPIFVTGEGFCAPLARGEAEPRQVVAEVGFQRTAAWQDERPDCGGRELHFPTQGRHRERFNHRAVCSSTLYRLKV